MWKDRDGRFRTLEEDIAYIWEKHGMRVIKESIEDDCWIIKAVKIKSRNPEDDYQPKNRRVTHV